VLWRHTQGIQNSSVTLQILVIFSLDIYVYNTCLLDDIVFLDRIYEQTKECVETIDLFLENGKMQKVSSSG